MINSAHIPNIIWETVLENLKNGCCQDGFSSEPILTKYVVTVETNKGKIVWPMQAMNREAAIDHVKQNIRNENLLNPYYNVNWFRIVSVKKEVKNEHAS